jgi:hypothetical protein
MTKEQIKLAARLLAAKAIFDAIGNRDIGGEIGNSPIAYHVDFGDLENADGYAIVGAMEDIAYDLIGKKIKFNTTGEILAYASKTTTYRIITMAQRGAQPFNLKNR